MNIKQFSGSSPNRQDSFAPSQYRWFSEDMPDDYYKELLQSANEIIQLGLLVVPAMEKHIPRDHYTGLTEFDQWRESHYPDWEDPDQFGYHGMDIAGYWADDKSVFHGLYPIWILDDGTTQIRSREPYLSPEQVSRQIELAQEYQLPLCLASASDMMKALTRPELLIPNAIIFANSDDLISLNWHHGFPRIESNRHHTWAYGYVDLNGFDFWQNLENKKEKLFKLDGSESPVGLIRHNFIQPCYPSIFFGDQVRLVQQGGSCKLLSILSAAQSGIDLDFDDDLYEDDGCDLWDDDDCEDQEQDDGESLDACWSCHPDEDERHFAEAVRRYENSSKIDKSIIRLSTSNIQESSCDSAITTIDHVDVQQKLREINLTEQAWFDRLFPPDLAFALHCRTKNLPYDELTVSVAYLTCIAGVLKLGTKINGNPLTKYEVPPNLYTALIGGSGAKKTAGKGAIVDQPVAPILLQLSQQNTRELRKWEEDNRGIKKDEKSPKPVPVIIRSQDYSPEALVGALQKADEYGVSFSIIRDELNGLFKSMNQYARPGQGAGEEQLLEIYDGKPFESLRVSTPRSYQRCSVSIYGNLQPSVFRDLTKNPDATGQWARFLFVPLPQRTVPLPVECTQAEQEELEDAVKMLENYASMAFALSPKIYTFDKEARRIFSSYEYEKQQGVYATANESKSALHGKSAGKVLRITGLIHILSLLHKSSHDPLSIGPALLEQAIALVDHLDHWALTQYTSREASPQSQIMPLMRRLHDLALKKGGTVTWTYLKDCLSSAEAQQLNRMKAEEYFRSLQALGYGQVSFGKRGGLCYTALQPLPPK